MKPLPARTAILVATVALSMSGVPAAHAVAIPVVITPEVTVTNTDDTGPGSLRDAIETINSPVAWLKTTILFDIPGGGPHVIAPVTNLPAITGAASIIDGYSQVGAAPATFSATASLQIVIDAAGLARGLRLEADNSTITGLVVHNADSGAGNGIAVVGDDNSVTGNYVGVTPNGEALAPNTGIGIDVRGDGNVVGGSTAADRNVVSGNGDEGIILSGNRNVVTGNRIGTDDDGLSRLPNLGAGVLVEGDDNRIGGLSAGLVNVISGNVGGGVMVADGSGSVVTGNLIGTTRNGSVPLGNGAPFISADGVRVEADDSTVSGNVIAGNTGTGVSVAADRPVIQHNWIGINAAGTVTMPNDNRGISLDGDDGLIGGVGRGNVVAANFNDGIYLSSGAGPNKGTIVQGNTIGTTSAGAAVGNSDNGILVASHDTQIGGLLPGQGNVVASNDESGIRVRGNNVKIMGNLIGTDPTGAVLPNLGDGIVIDGTGTTVAANTVANNGGDGIRVATGEANTVQKNVIHDNGGLGIDLGTDGVLANDPGDTDTGANGLLNHPVVTTARTGVTGTAVDWRINQGLPSTSFVVEFFVTAVCDPSNHGEAQRALGSVLVTTDATGFAAGRSTLPVVSAATWITATATTTTPGQAPPLGLGSTSELSACVEVL